MKPVPFLLAICVVGYAASHWQELRSGHVSVPAEAPRLIIYGMKSEGSFVKLDSELNGRNVPHQTRDLGDDANVRELIEKRARIGKLGGEPKLPAADIDGVLVEGATFPEIMRRLH